VRLPLVLLQQVPEFEQQEQGLQQREQESQPQEQQRLRHQQ
jgi:hypothetical protein